MLKFYVLPTISFMVLCISLSFGQQAIPYGSNHGKYVTISHAKIYYEEYGKGMPLLLLEGGMKSIKDFSQVIPELQSHYRVITPDDPGQGRSEMMDTMTYDLLADYVSQFMDILKLDSVYVMGWSDGGIAALILAAKRPDKVKKVIACGANYTKYGYTNSDSSKKDTLQLLSPDYQLPPEEQKWADQYFVANKSQWRKIINDRMVMWYQDFLIPRDMFNKINIPTMIVSGDRDIIRLEHSMEMYRFLIKGQLCILPNTSHNVFGERPALIADIAIKFFQK